MRLVLHRLVGGELEASGGSVASTSEPSHDAVLHTVRALLAERIGGEVCDEIGWTDDLQLYGVGSLDLVAVIAALEQRYGIDLGSDLVLEERASSIADLATSVIRGAKVDGR